MNICRLFVLCNEGNFMTSQSARKCSLLQFLRHSVPEGYCYQTPEQEKRVLLSKIAMNEVQNFFLDKLFVKYE